MPAIHPGRAGKNQHEEEEHQSTQQPQQLHNHHSRLKSTRCQILFGNLQTRWRKSYLVNDNLLKVMWFTINIYKKLSPTTKQDHLRLLKIIFLFENDFGQFQVHINRTRKTSRRPPMNNLDQKKGGGEYRIIKIF